MRTMRRVSILLAGAAYLLSFVLVCLGGCLIAEPGADHDCCPKQEGAGIRALADRDCCSVVPGLSQVTARLSPEPPSTVLTHTLADLTARLEMLAWRPFRAASPPLVLRI